MMCRLPGDVSEDEITIDAQVASGQKKGTNLRRFSPEEAIVKSTITSGMPSGIRMRYLQVLVNILFA